MYVDYSSTFEVCNRQRRVTKSPQPENPRGWTKKNQTVQKRKWIKTCVLEVDGTQFKPRGRSSGQRGDPKNPFVMITDPPILTNNLWEENLYLTRKEWNFGTKRTEF